ncbi:MAG TPA: G5 domain-containing protein [Pilimelia sp.]|nr:G5 domain-containing protein [Pilimelia sp.]
MTSPHLGIRVLRVMAVASAGLLLACAPQAPRPSAGTAIEPPATGTSAAETSATGTPAASATPTTAAPSPATGQPPVIEKRIVTASRSIPFTTRTVKDSSLPVGTNKIRVNGVAGVKTLTYEVTYTNGVETGRTLLRESVTTAPVTKVIAVGTGQPQRQCDPNYSGACVPIASDVDCAGGSGNGPAYVAGPVRVIGRDIYGLDNDHDGIGCE